MPDITGTLRHITNYLITFHFDERSPHQYAPASLGQYPPRYDVLAIGAIDIDC